MRVAVIGRTGSGDWGHAIDELWLKVPNVEIVAIADAHEDGLAKAAERLNCSNTFLDWHTMLAETKPDIVAICMRFIDCHAEMAIAAVESGAKGVFLEKPFVRSCSEADAVIKACEKTGAKLSTALVNRYSPTWPVIREIIDSGRIGQLLELRGRGKEDTRGGGEDLWVLGTHILDMMNNLGGDPLWCQATVSLDGKPITKSDAVECPEGIGLVAGDRVDATWGLADGPIAFFSSVRKAGLKTPNFGLTLVGTKGAIHILSDRVPHAYYRPEPLWRVDKEIPGQPITSEGIGKTEDDPDASREGWGRRAAVDLVDAITEDREPESGMYSSRTGVEMIAAVYQSALSEKRITWPLVERKNPLE